MTQPITAQHLSSLLDILNNPDHPSFADAIARITSLDTATLTPDLAVSLQARLQTTIENLTNARTVTAEQLTNLRRGNSALKSYGSK